MAKYNVKRSCGHEETVELYGKSSERERRIAFLEKNVCTECLRKQNLVLLAEDIDNGMCDLQGTEKQRPYAAAIRHTQWLRIQKWVQDSQAVLARSLENGDIDAAEHDSLMIQAKENLDIANTVFATCDSSKWWIERKDLQADEIFRHILTWAYENNIAVETAAAV